MEKEKSGVSTDSLQSFHKNGMLGNPEIEGVCLRLVHIHKETFCSIPGCPKIISANVDFEAKLRLFSSQNPRKYKFQIE